MRPPPPCCNVPDTGALFPVDPADQRRPAISALGFRAALVRLAVEDGLDLEDPAAVAEFTGEPLGSGATASGSSTSADPVVGYAPAWDVAYRDE